MAVLFLHSMFIWVSGMIYGNTFDFNVAVVFIYLILSPFFLFLFIPLPEADIVNFLQKILYFMLFK